MGKINLQKLRQANLPHPTWSDLVQVTKGNLSDDDQRVINEYLTGFVLGNCPGCEKTLIGDVIDSVFGMATFEWGLANGEGHCGNCGYPARAYHRDIDPIKFIAYVLAYHPDVLVEQAKGEAEHKGEQGA